MIIIVSEDLYISVFDGPIWLSYKIAHIRGLYVFIFEIKDHVDHN